MSSNDDNMSLVELNVGGVIYTTTARTLNSSDETSNLKSLITNSPRDSANRQFIDRDGNLFRFVLDYLRTRTLVLPENFAERQRLRAEAEYFQLTGLVKLIGGDASSSTGGASTNGNGGGIEMDPRSLTMLSLPSPSSPVPALKIKKQSGGCIIVGYRGTFANGRDGLADVKFRKISRILVCGRVQLMREVFGDTLNESRDPDHGVSDRYTSRFFLKHTFLEQAFDTLLECNFKLVCAAATGTNSTFDKDNKIQQDNEENKWLHYSEFIFVRNSSSAL